MKLGRTAILGVFAGLAVAAGPQPKGPVAKTPPAADGAAAARPAATTPAAPQAAARPAPLPAAPSAEGAQLSPPPAAPKAEAAKPAPTTPEPMEADPGKRPERVAPPQPVTASAFGYPYVYTERFAARGDVPATVLLKVQDRGVTAYVRNAKGDDSYSAADLKLDTTVDRIAFGVTPAFHLKGGFRLAFGLDSEQWEAKSRVGGAASGKARQSWELTTFSLQGATRVEGPWAVGLKYSSSRLSLSGDARGTGGVLSTDDERFADIRPSVALIHSADEVHAEFLPKLEYRAGSGEFIRPATPKVHYRRTLAPGRVAFADAEYALWAATGKGRASAPALSGGYVTSQPRWGDVGGSVGYRAKHYAAASAAAPGTIARFEGGLFADIRPDRDTHYAFSVDGAIGQDRGESPAGNGAAIRTQEISYQLAFARLL